MDNEHNKEATHPNKCGTREELKSSSEAEFDFLTGLTDAELDNLLDCATYEEEQYKEESVRIIDAVMSEFERRNPSGFLVSDAELQLSLDRFYERARAKGIAGF